MEVLAPYYVQLLYEMWQTQACGTCRSRAMPVTDWLDAGSHCWLRAAAEQESQDLLQPCRFSLGWDHLGNQREKYCNQFSISFKCKLAGEDASCSFMQFEVGVDCLLIVAASIKPSFQCRNVIHAVMTKAVCVDGWSGHYWGCMVGG